MAADQEIKDKLNVDPPTNSEENIGRDFLSTDYIPKNIPKIFVLKIIGIDSIVFDGNIQTVVIPTLAGEIAILPGHTPLFMQMSAGKVLVEEENSNKQEFSIDGGLARITQTEATLLVGFSVDQKDDKTSETDTKNDENKGK